MNVIGMLSAAAVVGGLASGIGALESAEAARPPIEWNDLPFVAVGSAIASAFVVGLQVLLKNLKAARLFSWFFGMVGLYFAVSGLVAFAIAVSRGPVAPSSLFVLSIGVGAIVGALIIGRVTRGAFAI